VLLVNKRQRPGSVQQLQMQRAQPEADAGYLKGAVGGEGGGVRWVRHGESAVRLRACVIRRWAKIRRK